MPPATALLLSMLSTCALWLRNRMQCTIAHDCFTLSARMDVSGDIPRPADQLCLVVHATKSTQGGLDGRAIQVNGELQIHGRRRSVFWERQDLQRPMSCLCEEGEWNGASRRVSQNCAYCPWTVRGVGRGSGAYRPIHPFCQRSAK